LFVHSWCLSYYIYTVYNIDLKNTSFLIECAVSGN
jgi:hypothetical protein